MLVRCFSVLLFVAAASVTPLAAESARTTYGNFPLVFEPNQGQSDGAVRFLSHGNGYGLYLTDTEAVLSIARPASAVVRMKFASTHARPQITGVEPQPGSSHYFRGADPDQWQKEIPHFRAVRYREVYPGIDLQYYGNQKELEYDFEVAPGADPSAIALDFQGVNRVWISDDGDLILDTNAGVLKHRRPIAYQDESGARKSVEAKFVMRGANRVGLEVGRFNRELPLTIDPVLVYSTYLGGSDTAGMGDQGNSVAVDSAGNAYITGFTSSTDFWTQNPVQATSGGGLDGFVLKLDPTGLVVLAASYFGGSGDEDGHRIALDGAGNIYITGFTSSPNFPIVNGFQKTRGGGEDAYLLKLNNSFSSIVYSTYLGGSGDERAYGLSVDAAGNAYIAGTTGSTNFPVLSALQTKIAGGLADGFVAKFTPAGSLAYSTLLGGRGNDLIYDVARDAAGNAYVTGFTTSIDFPVVKALHDKFVGGEDAFIAEINPSGNALVFSTYWGGNATDNGVRLAVDTDRNIYVTGYTSSSDFPVKNALQPNLAADITGNITFDAFLIKLTPDGADVAFATYLGGEDADSAAALALDPAGNIYLAGFTASFQFYVVNAVQGFNHGGRDAWVMKLMPDGQHILYSTYIGGSGNDGALGLTLDAAGNVYAVGYTGSPDFPVASAFQPSNVGGFDGFLAKINADDIKARAEFVVAPQGLATLSTSAQTSTATFGYAAADVAAGSAAPSGLALLDLRQQGLLITDLGLPLTSLIQNGRLFEQSDSAVNTGVAFVNPNSDAVTINFDYTALDGTVGNFGSVSLDPGKSIAGFVVGDPFNIPSGSAGTFSFSASAPVAAVAFRSSSAASSQLQLSYVPIADLDAPLQTGAMTIPEFTDGASWTTHIILVNPTENDMGGEIRFFAGGEPGVVGHPTEVNLAQGHGSVFEYAIPPRSAIQFQSTGLDDSIHTGYIQVIPFPGMNTPQSSAVLTLAENGIANLDTTVEGQIPAADFNLYVDASGSFETAEALSARTAVSFANPSNTVVNVTMELRDLQGNPSGFSAQLQLPPRGHTSAFLNELVGFLDMPSTFEGILRVTATGEGVAVTGLRGRYNESGRFVATTTGPLKPISGTVVFPHIVNGAGYATKLILVNTTRGQSVTGAVRFMDETGSPLFMGVVPGNGFQGK
jgi:hypothetical protein